MSSEREKILRMVADGKVSAAEGNELLEALGCKPHNGWKRVFNPFDHLFGVSGLVLSTAIALASVMLSWITDLRFDGFLDVHFSEQPVTFLVAILDQIVSWCLPAVLFWLASLLLARQGRFVDFLTLVGLARLPLLLFALVTTLAFPDPSTIIRIAIQQPLHPLLWLGVLVGLGFAVWIFMWLYNGFKTASGLVGGRLIGTFIWIVFLAEIGSKVLLYAYLVSSVATTPSKEWTYALPGESHELRAEALLELLESGETGKAWRTFDPKMKEMPQMVLDWTWRIARWKRGPLLSVNERRLQEREGHTIVDLLCAFEGEKGVVRVVFDSEDRVSGLWLLKPEQALPPQFKREE